MAVVTEHPSHGGRIVLMRQEQDAMRVRYQARLAVPEVCWQADVAVELSTGRVLVDAWTGEGEPPAWLVQALLSFLRTQWRLRRTEPAPSWPRRIARWRPGPTPTSPSNVPEKTARG